MNRTAMSLYDFAVGTSADIFTLGVLTSFKEAWLAAELSTECPIVIELLVTSRKIVISEVVSVRETGIFVESVAAVKSGVLKKCPEKIHIVM